MASKSHPDLRQTRTSMRAISDEDPDGELEGFGELDGADGPLGAFGQPCGSPGGGKGIGGVGTGVGLGVGDGVGDGDGEGDPEAAASGRSVNVLPTLLIFTQ
jgi:hypothetical protein